MDIKKNIDLIRNDFPILSTSVNGNKLVYLDNAATSQTPNCVIDSISDYYRNLNSNIHRGVHFLSQKATEIYEETRFKFKKHFDHKIERLFDKHSWKEKNSRATLQQLSAKSCHENGYRRIRGRCDP